MMVLISDGSDDGLAFSEEFRTFRGGAVATFSQAEYSIAHLLLKLKDRRDLTSLELTDLPFRLEARTKMLCEICSKNDALREFLQQAENIHTNMDRLALIRNFLAHGFARIDVQAREVKIRKFSPIKGDTWNVEVWDLDRAEIPERTAEIDLFGEFVWSFVCQINEKHALGF